MNNLTKRNPVLLIHGIWDTSAVFNPMTAYLSQRGLQVYSFDLIPNDGTIGLDILARQIAEFIDRTFTPEQHFDLVGFSMGGIVSRYYVQRLGGIDRVQRFITISSPHYGTLTAYSRMLPGYVQMRPGSSFLQDLNDDVTMLEKINFTSIWMSYDAMILPAHNSQMPVGKEIKKNVLFHHQMVKDMKVIQVIAEELEAPIGNRG
ncbi:lipase [Oscillatoriales cyanobacterium USR001]|nr:lipase [Oscillatoriales cyanobacterium USR001]